MENVTYGNWIRKKALRILGVECTDRGSFIVASNNTIANYRLAEGRITG
jgi:hypothetical protein